ncbi:hypothetical protein EVAR_50524_1 [Eumeta japonica]|uniref:Uncharacterized protein n=1 Tax=Eumeta variegata TaxID=151549 RepID=A0A4C1X9F8_EUMVA|nr:hypothetical protein EVAR_50524_1 [Eumeta japonica]
MSRAHVYAPALHETRRVIAISELVRVTESDRNPWSLFYKHQLEMIESNEWWEVDAGSTCFKSSPRRLSLQWHYRSLAVPNLQCPSAMG